jgi:hypothetical protein
MLKPRAARTGADSVEMRRMMIRLAIHESSLDDERSNGQESVSKQALGDISRGFPLQWVPPPVLGAAVRQQTRGEETGTVRVQWESGAVQRSARERAGRCCTVLHCTVMCCGVLRDC